jgi:hypothetical protein
MREKKKCKGKLHPVTGHATSPPDGSEWFNANAVSFTPGNDPVLIEQHRERKKEIHRKRIC